MLPCAFLSGAWSFFVMMGFLLAVSFGAMAYSYVVRKS